MEERRRGIKMLFKSKEPDYELFLRKEVLECAKDGVISLRSWFEQLENTISIYLIVESLLINAILLTFPIMLNLCSKVINIKYIVLSYFINMMLMIISLIFTLYAKKLRMINFEKNPLGLYSILEEQMMNYKDKKQDIQKDTYMSIILMYQDIFQNNKKVNEIKAKCLKNNRIIMIFAILLYCGQNILLLMEAMLK